jgi:hypothetical protein
MRKLHEGNFLKTEENRKTEYSGPPSSIIPSEFFAGWDPALAEVERTLRFQGLSLRLSHAHPIGDRTYG